MLVARTFDGSDAAGPYLSPAAPRLAEPEQRSRVAGYLGTAPLVADSYRTDGVWVWPTALCDLVRTRGVGPQLELLEHIVACDYVAPQELPGEVTARAVRAAASGPPPPPADDVTYLAGRIEGVQRPELLIRWIRVEDGSISEATLGPYGWEPGQRDQAGGPGAPTGFEPLSGRAAAHLADALCERWHREAMSHALESAEEAPPPYVARLFDGESPNGTPWFTPTRLRLVDRERRERLAAYLTSGRLVVRVAGRMTDPLAPERGPIVPLNYRTDGSWVWPDALGYYVRTRGVAPELAFLCHVEERGLEPPRDVPDAAVQAAAAAIKRGPGRSASRRQFAYFIGGPIGQTLVRQAGGDRSAAEAFTADLRWRFFDGGWRDGHRFREIDEAAAIRLVDDRWASMAAART